MMSYQDIDVVITKVKGIALSSPYGDGNSLGQPLGVKSLGFIKVYTNIGEVGVGESYAGVYAPELIAPTVKFLESFIIGRMISDDTICTDLSGIPFIGRNGFIRSVISAVDIALWDLRGKILGCPSYMLLGKKYRSKVPVYASSGTAAFTPDEIADDVKTIVELGYKAYKMRVGFQDWSKDLSRVATACRMLDGNDLMVDAIMGTISPPWGTKQAISYTKDLEEFDLHWLEEPVHPENIAGLASVRSKSNIPIAAGEAYSGDGKYQSLLDQNAVDILQFDATHSGGIGACIQLAHQAIAKGLKSAVHVWGSAVAIAANAHVALGSYKVDVLEIPMVELEITKHVWVDMPNIENGIWCASNLPGLGVELNDFLIEKYPLVTGSGYRLLSK